MIDTERARSRRAEIREGTVMALNQQQREEIQRRLDAGMSPDAIAQSLGRIADLDDLEIEEIRSTAIGMQGES